MEYANDNINTNDNIKKLIAERNAAIEKYNHEIQRISDKEKDNREFSWKGLLLMLGAIIFIVTAINLNKKIFPKTSIWSFEYYMDEQKPRVGIK